MSQNKKVASEEFMQMWAIALKNLHNNIEIVNGLNVFPVPDGDTGTNMHLTLKSAVNNMSKEDTSLSDIALRISKGSLMGARGNSGVILSQILRGFSNSLSDVNELTAQDFANALQNGSETAYKAVIRPVEGTILTVCKDAAKVAIESAEEGNNLLKVMRDTIEEASASLERTPDLLPVLKKAGVVDAGGKGLLIIMQGWYKALAGDKVDLAQELPSKAQQKQQLPTEEEGYGYCTEFMIKADEKYTEEITKTFDQIGESLVVVGIDDIIKVHVHSTNPGVILEEALKFGELINIKIENMQEQHSHIQSYEEEPREKLDTALIAVGVGEGISEIFRSMGANYIIEGGQTMNPSTEDIVSAIQKLNAENVYILPNNSNIILAAEQSKDLVDANVAVIPSKNIPQGFAAMMGYNPEGDFEEVRENMISNMSYVNSAEITFATRDFKADFGNIEKGDVIGINNGDIIVASKDPDTVLYATLDKMVDDDTEIISVFTGNGYHEEDSDLLLEQLQERYPDYDIEVHYGGQPLYYFLISVE
ncbi:MAG: DAK2 domain-containing protein [Clostridia bacterium]